MQFSNLLCNFLLPFLTSALLVPTDKALNPRQISDIEGRSFTYIIKPKVWILSMFPPEGKVWWGIPEFDLLAINITIPGVSPIYPDAHCTIDGEVCQLIVGESEINAASSVTALVNSDRFDLTTTYFMIAGIAGINPEVATLASVTLARYAVQVALQYEFDARDIPSNFSTGYIPLGSQYPDEYPQSIYGTEVFEVNKDLRDMAISFASTAALNDSDEAIAYRALYAPDGAYSAATLPPSVVPCDVATSDVYYSGDILSEAFGNTTALFTNGSGIYCSTAQEDNASLEAMLRAAVTGLVDFSRIIVMRTASDFDRPPPGISATYNLWYADQGGFVPAVANLYIAGIKIVEGILTGWNTTFEKGITPTNYIGDIFGTLGGTPDFGPGSIFNDNPVVKRDIESGKAERPRGRIMKGRRAVYR